MNKDERTIHVGNTNGHVVVVEEKIFKNLLEQRPLFDLSARRMTVLNNLRTCENFDDFNRVIMEEADRLNIEAQLNEAYEIIADGLEPEDCEAGDLLPCDDYVPQH